jgi:hypothetical protein
MQLSVFAEALDRQNFPAIAFHRQNETGKHRLPVQQNRASSALAQFAAVFRACMAELFAQYFQQSFVRREGDVGFFAI